MKFWNCTLYIGGHKNERLVREGPYATVRNPLYVFSLIGTAGISLQTGMISVCVLMVSIFLIYYTEVIKREEAFLFNKFGEVYAEYMRSVPRWILNFKLWREPEQVEAQPGLVRQTMQDAALFFVPFPCFELLEVLHGRGILPTYFILP